MKQTNRSDMSSKQRSKGKKVAKRAGAKRRKVEGEYEGIYYESGCELACIYWLINLRKKGYVSVIRRCPSFLLCDAVVNNYAEQLKRGSKSVQQTITKGHTYTPDYVAVFTEKALGKFVWNIDSNTRWSRNLMVGHKDEGGYVVYIEVKPDYDRNNTTGKAVNDMKWVFQKYELFINLFKPDHRFDLTFCPEEYIYTQRGDKRKLRFSPRNINDYLNSLT